MEDDDRGVAGRGAGSLRRFEEEAGAGSAVRHPEGFRLYGEARQNYEIVAGDPAAWIHNFRYAQDLLQRSEERLEAALGLLGAGAAGGHGGQR